MLHSQRGARGSLPAGKGRLVHLLLASASILASLGIVEISLRVWGRYADMLSLQDALPDGPSLADPEIGHVREPNVSWEGRRSEFTYSGRSNSLGFWDEEIPADKDPGEIRVWVLGDSIAAGFGVLEEERFSERLQDLLNAPDPLAARGGRPVRVVNAAVSGHGTWHQAILMERYFDRVSPDAVLLGFTTTNDFFDNRRFAAWKRAGGAYYKSPAHAGQVERYLRTHLHLYHLLMHLKVWTWRRGSISPEEREATVEALERMRSACRAHAVPLTVAVMTTLDAFWDLDDPRTRHADAYRVTMEILRVGGYRFIDTVGRLGASGDHLTRFYSRDRHPNPAGHAQLASILADEGVLSREFLLSR